MNSRYFKLFRGDWVGLSYSSPSQDSRTYFKIKIRPHLREKRTMWNATRKTATSDKITRQDDKKKVNLRLLLGIIADLEPNESNSTSSHDSRTYFRSKIRSDLTISFERPERRWNWASASAVASYAFPGTAASSSTFHMGAAAVELSSTFPMISAVPSTLRPTSPKPRHRPPPTYRQKGELTNNVKIRSG